MANRRIEILAAVLSLRGTGGPVSDLLWNLFVPPCDVMGPRRVERITEISPSKRAVWIKGIDRPLYLPAEFRLHNLHQMLSEGTYPRNWHYYCTAETPVTPEDVLFDIGAAEGLFSFLARRKGARVVAFEPHPHYFRSLQENFSDDDRVLLVNSALGDTPATAFLSESNVASSVSDNGEYPIRVETLDAVCDRLKIFPTYLKADIEGYEENMLKGATETIATYHPKIAITTYHAANDAQRMMALLRGYWPRYKFRTKGISDRHGKPVMLHAWS